ncbi:MAG TPA: citryl-CoA lyase [Acidobacteriota bacterium]|nr:citryl-CoA lyase [Acidobacteriota bacterium]
MDKWYTSLTEIAPNRVALRGRPLEDLMGELSFGGAVYLLFTGKEPTQAIARLVDAILVSSIDHGVTPPSALASRNASSTGAALNACIASGVLAINRFHGGAIEGCMGVLARIADLASKERLSPGDAADRVVAEEKAAGRRIPGYGHRIHTDDPRAKRLLALAAELGLRGVGIEAAEALGQAIERALGRKLPLNVDGAIAACLIDLGIEFELANAFFIIARVPGLAAHAREEHATQRPMRKIDPKNAEFSKDDPTKGS